MIGSQANWETTSKRIIMGSDHPRYAPDTPIIPHLYGMDAID